MVKLFSKGWNQVTVAVDDIVDPESPITTLPDHTNEHPASLGDDINLPLLVREMGERKKYKLIKRREELVKEMDMVDKELMQLDVLLDAANSL
jgi:hypothetical protein